MENPKLFVSYSWSSVDHEQWVIDLATELRESGVDVILDKWDLKEGHDSIGFMEKMVADPEIKKVLIICDKKYAEKADGRAGGVGTETQIISREVYENQTQDKFVAVVCERDSENRAILPTYYKSRIYIDLSQPEIYSENFEKLLRWIFNKPLHLKPGIGKKPAFLSEENPTSLGTSSAFKRVLDAIKNQKPYGLGSLDEYIKIFSENLERFRISGSEQDFDEKVLKSIDDFSPYRSEIIQLVTAISQYSPEKQFIVKIEDLFEKIAPYIKPNGRSPYNEWDFDNYKFIIHEAFLYSLAILIKHGQFGAASDLLARDYYIPDRDGYEGKIFNYMYFREYMRSLEHRNQRLDLRRLSLRADLLKDRNNSSGVEFRYILQADFICFMRAEIQINDYYNRWWPETLLYTGRHHGAFEIFERSKSRAYFEKVKPLLGITEKDEMLPLLNSYRTHQRDLPKWQFESFDPKALLGYENIATKP
ncbi:TIR domain-containing protein [uncultured Pseudomonas sp.]|uniref:SEFIR domain-containing protein n=1 Tax=uncultured Pseudomonas sp. TaxID=114707 RepID=UPI0025842217|nr:TIR domain-containing protein [uncultured Pseudomonas sp.]